jgi:hypothetical protein
MDPVVMSLAPGLRGCRFWGKAPPLPGLRERVAWPGAEALWRERPWVCSTCGR